MERNEESQEKNLANKEFAPAATRKSRRKNVLAAVQSVRITTGGYGKTLEKFIGLWSIPSSTVLKLRRSTDFMKLARDLDKKYVSHASASKYRPEYDSRNRIKSGKKGMPKSYIGKKELIITVDSAGAHFAPFESPDHMLGADLIMVKHKSGARFLQEIVHESCHARNYVYSTASPPKGLVAAIRADTQEEIKVRKREQKILDEINKGLKTQLKFSPVGSTVPAIVGRDFAPGLGLTYLENSFFSSRLLTTQAQDGLTEEQAGKMRERLSKNPDEPLTFLPFPNPKNGIREISEYGKTWKDRLKAKKSWKAFYKSGKRNSASAREALIQKHAKLFFRGFVRYSKLP